MMSCYGFKNLEHNGLRMEIETQSIFHSRTMARRKKNKVEGLKIGNDDRCFDSKVLQHVVESF